MWMERALSGASGVVSIAGSAEAGRVKANAHRRSGNKRSLDELDCMTWGVFFGGGIEAAPTHGRARALLFCTAAQRDRSPPRRHTGNLQTVALRSRSKRCETADSTIVPDFHDESGS